jgi:diacylglycerol kinase (ATP)
LHEAGHEVVVRLTEYRGHGTALAAAAVQAQHGAVIVCGGDGTIAEVLPSLAQTHTALGLIPLGTGNDLARALGIPRSPASAVRLLHRGLPSTIDLGRCGDRWFATVAAFGFDAEISQIMEGGDAPLHGTAGYLLASLRHLRTYVPPRVRLSGDFGTLEREVFLAAIANTRSYGGGLRIAPDANPEDGCFDICIVDGGLSRSRLLSLLPKVFWGGHIGHPAVQVLRTRLIHLEPVAGQHLLHADGEPLVTTPAMLEIEARALRVIRPTVAATIGAYHMAPSGAR